MCSCTFQSSVWEYLRDFQEFESRSQLIFLPFWISVDVQPLSTQFSHKASACVNTNTTIIVSFIYIVFFLTVLVENRKLLHIKPFPDEVWHKFKQSEWKAWTSRQPSALQKPSLRLQLKFGLCWIINMGPRGKRSSVPGLTCYIRTLQEGTWQSLQNLLSSTRPKKCHLNFTWETSENL